VTRHRVYHKPTASLYARMPKCANNAVRFMLFAQFRGATLTDQQLMKAWDDGNSPHRPNGSQTVDKGSYAYTGTITVDGPTQPWDQQQLQVRPTRASHHTVAAVACDTRCKLSFVRSATGPPSTTGPRFLCGIPHVTS
jgi:hypothetical protein